MSGRLVPDFWRNFHCIAERCTDNCCAGWAVDIDECSLAKYQAMSEADREWLLEGAALEPGSASFRLNAYGRCHFLGDDGLCRMIKRLGEASLCDICREHPRFYHWLNGWEEAGLGLCCEEAAGLVLTAAQGLHFVWESEMPEIPTDEPEGQLFDLRAELTALLQDRELPLKERVRILSQEMSLGIFGLADAGGEPQMPDSGAADTAGLPSTASSPSTASFLSSVSSVNSPSLVSSENSPNSLSTASLPGAATLQIKAQEMKYAQGRIWSYSGFMADMRALLRRAEGLEAMHEDWPKQLCSLREFVDTLSVGNAADKMSETAAHNVLSGSALRRLEAFEHVRAPFEYERENLLVYLLYRHLPSALSDGRIRARICFALDFVRLVELWHFADWTESGSLNLKQRIDHVKRISQEWEYSEENMKYLLAEYEAGLGYEEVF